MTNFEFLMKGFSETKYGFKLNFRYYIDTMWSYDKCKIKVKTYYKKNIIYETTISENEYNSEIEKIQKKMKDGEYMKILVKDFQKCVACHESITEREEWVYEEYDMFCSRDCQRKPKADKCLKCNSNVSRVSHWKYPNYCSEYCAVHNKLSNQNLLPTDIITEITKKI
jgi:hypothetical protein